MRIKRVGIVAAVVGTAGVLALAPPAVQAAVNYFNEKQIVTGNLGFSACPTGWKLTGGGVAQLPADEFTSSGSLDTTTEYRLTGSYPQGNTWKATARYTYGSTFSGDWSYSSYTYIPQVYAVCVR